MGRKLYFNKKNYIFFIAGTVGLVLGYYLMSIGPHDSFWSLTLSPIIVVLSLTVLFPLGIMWNSKKKSEQD